MWSLPNINRMNSEAVTKRKALERACRTGKLDGKKLVCECAEYDEGKCSGQLYHTLWYDIFSDVPKGIITLCEHHEGYYGNPSEGYFTCADCERVMVENYTWEKYNTIIEGEEVCLPCAAQRYIADEDNWLELTPEVIATVNFERARKAKHVIGVEMPVPKGIKFFDNAEFDSMDGHQISGDDIQEILTRAMDEGIKKAILILDAAYQFAVSIGVYVPADALQETSTSSTDKAAA